jgi:tRNA-dihydrouridine synthase
VSRMAAAQFSWRSLARSRSGPGKAAPFCVLAPMLRVSDTAYRSVVAAMRGRRRREMENFEKSAGETVSRDVPLVLVTEFASAEGLCHSAEARRRLTESLLRHDVLGPRKPAERGPGPGPESDHSNNTNTAPPSERPVIAQLFGCDAGAVRDAASYCVRDLGFDGVDLNMGCPERHVVR